MRINAAGIYAHTLCIRIKSVGNYTHTLCISINAGGYYTHTPCGSALFVGNNGHRLCVSTVFRRNNKQSDSISAFFNRKNYPAYCLSVAPGGNKTQTRVNKPAGQPTGLPQLGMSRQGGRRVCRGVGCAGGPLDRGCRGRGCAGGAVDRSCRGRGCAVRFRFCPCPTFLLLRIKKMEATNGDIEA